jgi:hypothetical protein
MSWKPLHEEQDQKQLAESKVGSDDRMLLKEGFVLCPLVG